MRNASLIGGDYAEDFRIAASAAFIPLPVRPHPLLGRRSSAPGGRCVSPSPPGEKHVLKLLPIRASASQLLPVIPARVRPLSVQGLDSKAHHLA
jgi:hypothetical protein